MTGFSVFHHRLGHPRWQIKNCFRQFYLRNQRERRKGTHTDTDSGASAKDVKGSDLSSSVQGLGTSFRGATLIFADSFHRWLCIQRQARSEWTDENDLKQRVIYTTHPPHNTQRFEFYSSYGLKCKAIGPRGQRGMLVKHCYWLFEVNIKPVPRCHFHLQHCRSLF